MSRFQRFQFTAYPGVSADLDKGLKRSFQTIMVRPHSTYLREHLWVFARVLAVVALIGLVAFMVHTS
jgi:hypothetical protein